MPKVSVIVPNYNHSRFLGRRLESVYNQTFSDFEVILLDDCSTDNSVEILSQYAKHPKTSHFVLSNENSGSPFKQWAKGISLAKGEFIWIAESDDISRLDFLEKLLPLIITKEAVGMICCRSELINNDGNTVKVQPSWINTLAEDDFAILRGKDYATKYLINCIHDINVSACLFRSEAFKRIPLNCIDLNIKGDWLIYFFLLRISDIVLSNMLLNYFRKHSDSTSSSLNNRNLHYKETVEVYSILRANNLYPEIDFIKLLYYPFYKTIDNFLRAKAYKKAFDFIRLTAKGFNLPITWLLIKLIRYYLYFLNIKYPHK